MIRRSTAIAAVAILVSLFLHLLGLTVTTRDLSDRATEAQPDEVIATGTTFEDLAETLAEPVVPEPAPVPEPPVEPPQEPEAAEEPPTSEALVASSNPTPSTTPGAGPAEPAQPEVIEPSDVETAERGEVLTPQEVLPPVEPELAENAPPDDPANAPSTIETAAVDPAIAQPVAPDSLAPTPTPELSRAPTPEIAIQPVENADETLEATDPDPEELSETALAVASSLRPQLPERDLSTTSVEPFEENDAEQRPIIESPLALYRDQGIDLFAGRVTGNRSQGLDVVGSGGRGNANVSNYAGRILVHLNSFPTVPASARGSARVFFEISPDGSLAWVNIVDSTGSGDVERAAKSQVRRAAPFPTPPGGESRRLSFVYRIN